MGAGLAFLLLALIGEGAFTRYEAAHNRRFGLVVGPGVLAVLVGTIGLLVALPAAVPWWAPACVTLQARPHGMLAAGFDARTHAALVRSNWIRVAAWPASAGIALLMC